MKSQTMLASFSSGYLLLGRLARSAICSEVCDLEPLEIHKCLFNNWSGPLITRQHLYIRTVGKNLTIKRTQGTFHCDLPLAFWMRLSNAASLSLYTDTFRRLDNVKEK